MNFFLVETKEAGLGQLGNRGQDGMEPPDGQSVLHPTSELHLEQGETKIPGARAAYEKE